MLNIVILSNSKNSYLKALTTASIESLKNSYVAAYPPFDEIHILVVESCKNIRHENAEQIDYDWSKYTEFNYNYALNQGIEFFRSRCTRNDWYCFSNNDIIYDKNWILEISAVYQQFPKLESICPNLDVILKKQQLKLGYVLGENLNGCCILAKCSLIDDVLKSFDEDFSYYFQDDDYLEILKANNICHGKVMSSIIHHIESQTSLENTEMMKKLYDGRDIFIRKYGKDVYIKNEIDKQKYQMQLQKIRNMI